MRVERDQATPFFIGAWMVNPTLDRIEKGTDFVTLEPKAMQILLFLARRPNQVVSIDELIEKIWDGRIVEDNTVYQWIRILRKSLGDDAERPIYIETITKKGYRLIADVRAQSDAATHPTDYRGRGKATMIIAAILMVAFLSYLFLQHEPAAVDPTKHLGVSSAKLPTIAVLPFEDHSGNPSGLHFAEGMHDEVLTKLANLSSMRVISRSSVLAYGAGNLNLRVVGEELGADVIMEGGVQLADNWLRVNVQLIDAKSDTHLWAESYNRQLSASNLFAIQSDIANSVARALNVQVNGSERGALDSQPTASIEAYSAYRLGMHLLATRHVPAMTEAIEHFEEAIAHDPNYAQAFVGLANACYVLNWYSQGSSDELLAKSRSAIDRALRLNSQLGEAFATLAALTEDSDFPKAEAAYKQSIALSPNYATAYHWYGTILRRTEGRFAEAGPLLEKALELDPLSAIVNAELGTYLEQLGQFEAARRQMERVVKIDPAFSGIYIDLALLTNAAFGRVDESLALLFKEKSILDAGVDAGSYHRAWLYALIADAYLQVGLDERASAWAQQSLSLVPEHDGANWVQLKLKMFAGESPDGESYPAEFEYLPATFGDGWDSILNGETQNAFRYYDMQTHRLGQSRSRYADAYPDLLQPDHPKVSRYSFRAAVDLAKVLVELGETAHASQLLEQSLSITGELPRLGRYGYQITDVMIHAIQGAPEEAILALRAAIDAGWSYRARYMFELEPNLSSLHAIPAYQAMVSEVQGMLRKQRLKILEMESRGELPAPPDIKS